MLCAWGFFVNGRLYGHISSVFHAEIQLLSLVCWTGSKSRGPRLWNIQNLGAVPPESDVQRCFTVVLEDPRFSLAEYHPPTILNNSSSTTVRAAKAEDVSIYHR